MQEVLTRQGILIDVCPQCHGVWLDAGELNFFVRDKTKRQVLTKNLKDLKNPTKIAPKCPKCQSEMQRGGFSPFFFQVEKCLSCHGLFLDKTEFQKLSKEKVFSSIQKDRRVWGQRPQKEEKKPKSFLPLGVIKIPSLFWTTGTVCLSLYGILLLVLVFLMETQNLSFFFGIVMWLGLIVLQFCVAPIIIDWQLRAFGQTKWVSINKLPPHFKKSLLAICEQNRIPLPKMGIINDGSPQAFTYGRTPRSARVVFSQGMFELLDPEEAEAVLAHELGHIKHWDFVIMTLIKVVPTLLYIIYRKCKTMQESNRKQNIKGKQKADPTALAMVVSYILYLISEYLVLFVSRVREYHADRFSAFATKKPNKLLTALVKIAYGLLGSQPSKDSENSSSALKSKQDRLKGVEALNIMNVSRSKQLALASQGEGYHFNPQVIKDIMRWDLWSPWAFYYELHSTHPLTAKRIKALGAYALALQQEPFVRFQKEKPESYWDDFFSDLFVLCLPYVMGIGGLLAYAWSKDWNWDVISALFKEALVNKTSVSTGSIEIKIPAYPWGLLAGGALS